jgi:hypothetical protein
MFGFFSGQKKTKITAMLFFKSGIREHGCCSPESGNAVKNFALQLWCHFSILLCNDRHPQPRFLGIFTNTHSQRLQHKIQHDDKGYKKKKGIPLTDDMSSIPSTVQD